MTASTLNPGSGILPATTAVPVGGPDAPWGRLAAVIVGLAVLFGVYRLYQHATAFTVGLDYFEPAFQTYWMTLLYAELIIEAVVGTALLSWIWLTRESDLTKISPAEELRRYYVMFSWLFAFGFTTFIATSIYTEADAAWHQVAVRDTDFTPTHIGLFYFAIPMIIIMGTSAFLWTHTRVPQFAGRVSLGFALLVAGPMLIMPNLGLNEWGHTFFYAEELFAAPIHWGFVLLGWSAFAVGGMVVQALTRIVELTSLDAGDDTPAASA